MADLSYLLSDPRPELFDHRKWALLLRLIPTLEDQVKAEQIHKLLWSVRSCGVVLRWTTSGTMFQPLLDKTCCYDSAEEFKDHKDKHFRPYQPEISELLRKVELIV